MPNFSMVLTAAGAELLAKGVAGKTMQFTAIAVGDGTFSGSPVDATALQSEVKRLPIQRMTRRKNTVSLRATLEVGAVKSGFTWTELGVFATDPDTQGDVLYMYGYAGAESDTVPTANKPTTVEKIINVNAIVASAQNVTAIIDTSLVYLTQADLDAHNADPEANPAAIQAHNDNPKAHEELFSQKADLGEDGKIPDAQLPDMDYVARTGDTMTGNLTMSGDATVTGLPTPSGNSDAVPKSFLSAQMAKYLALSGGTMTGAINMNSKKITNLPTPSANGDAVPKSYLDQQVIANRRWKEIDRITTSKTWTVPSGVTQIGVLAIGGGQSGSITDNMPDSFSRFVFGGFCGHVSTAAFNVTAGQNFAITIGAGGLSTIANQGDKVTYFTAQPGGQTSFSGNGILLSANGGGIADGASLGGNGFYGSGRESIYYNYNADYFNSLIGDTLPYGKTSNIITSLFANAGTGEDYYIFYTFSDDFYLFDPKLKLLSPGGFIAAKYKSSEFVNVSQVNPPDLGALGRGGKSKCENNLTKLIGEDATGYGNGGGSILTSANLYNALAPSLIRAGNGSPGIVIIYA